MKRRRLIWSPDARRDLAEIYAYVSRQNPVAARRFVERLHAKARRLADLGLTGIRRADLGDGVHAVAFIERIILFKVHDDRLHILRVLHGRQDISILFLSNDD